MSGFTHTILLSAAEPPLIQNGMHFQLDPAMLVGAVVVLVGVFLLLFGRKVLRAGLGILGGLLGALAGSSIATNLDLGLSPLVCSIIGGVVGIGLGLVLCRVTVATVMATSSAVLAGLTLLVAIESGFVTPTTPAQPDHQPHASAAAPALPVAVTGHLATAETENRTSDWADLIQAQASQSIKAHAGQTESTVVAVCNRWLTTLNDQLDSVLTRLGVLWSQHTTTTRQAVLGVAALGGLVGFLLGLVAWKWSTTVASALVGAALVLLGGLLSAQIILPRLGETLWALHPGFWLIGWTALAVIGGLISWLSDRHRADRNQVSMA